MNGLTYTKGWGEDRKLLLKMSEIMGEVGSIPKTGFNKFHKYHYHSEADINKAFQDLFSKHKMVLMPSLETSEMRTTTTRSNNVEYIQKARMSFTIYDAETGESLVSHMEGEGQDVGDKALYKSISGTQKYFLMKTFMIQDQNDPEADEGVDERNAGKAPEPKRNDMSVDENGPIDDVKSKVIFAKIKAAKLTGWEEINTFLGYEIKRTNEVKLKDFKKLADWLDTKKVGTN